MQQRRIHLKAGAAALAATALGGCASIVGKPTQEVAIDSTPAGATISIVDEGGTEIFRGNTPSSVTLPKSTGRYFGAKNYSVTVSMAGYKSQIVPITASPNGWYLAGNFFIGGLIGWFAVDPFTGNMYTLSPEAIKSTLPEGTAAHNNRATDGSIAVLLLQDVPAAMRDKLVMFRR